MFLTIFIGEKTFRVSDIYKDIYYGFGLSLDTRDSNAYVSHAKRTRCYTKTATFPRANFLVWSSTAQEPGVCNIIFTANVMLYNVNKRVKMFAVCA